MSAEIIYRPPLETHFEVQTFGELGVCPSELIIHVRHQPTQLEKSGFRALIAKLPKIGNRDPVTLDVDVSCALYDSKGTLLDVVYYGKVRNHNDSVRHHGDTFYNMNAAFRPSVIEESLTVRLFELPSVVHGVAFFVHCATQDALKKLVHGEVSLVEGEGKVLHSLAFAGLDDGVSGICAWQLVRTKDNDWRMSAPMASIKAKDSGDIAKKWHSALSAHLF